MDLAALRIFRAVVREGGVTRAAEHLNRVQSNVTTRVRQLEEELGVALFIREGKRMHLSPAGQVLIDYADRILALAEEAKAAVQDSEMRGTFRVGAMESTAAVRLPAPLSEYHRLYPDVTLELRTGHKEILIRALLSGEVDAAFIPEPLDGDSFETAPAFVEDLVIVARGDHPPIGPEDGLPKTVVTFEVGCPHRARLEAWFDSHEAKPEELIEMNSYHAMLGCVLVGMGVALLPRSVLSTFPEAKRLSLHPLPPGQDRLPTALAWRKGAHSPKIDALIEILRTPAALSVA